MSWLGPWEATAPPDLRRLAGMGARGPRGRAGGFPAMVRALRTQARLGSALPFAVTYDTDAEQGRFVGQLTVSGITYGSARWGQIGYWVDQAYAGRGIIPTAVALATDHCFFRLGLHRIEINIRPENTASLRVAEKLGFRHEGTRRAYLHINGAWRDHAAFAMNAEEVPEGVLARWQRANPGPTGHDLRRHTG